MAYKKLPKPKAINPIEKVKYESDRIALETLKEDQQRQIKYGPKGKLVPKVGTNDSF